MSMADFSPTSPPWSPLTRAVVGIILLIFLVWIIILALPLIEALLISALLAYLLAPLVRYIVRRMKVKRSIAVVIVYGLIIIIIASLPTALGVFAVGQIQNFGISLNEAIQAIQERIYQPLYLFGFRIIPTSLMDNIGQAIGSVVAIAPGGSMNILSGLTTNLLWGVVVFISLYYFLKDGPLIKPWLVGFFPAAYQSDARRLVDEIDDVWTVFLRVQIFIFFVLAVLFILGAVLVVLLYRAGLIPFSWIGLIVMLIIVYTLVQQVDNLWLRPQMLGQRLRLHPAVVFVSLVGALALSGVLGALIVVPGIATAKVIGNYIHSKMLGVPPWISSEEAELAAIHSDEQGEYSHNSTID